MASKYPLLESGYGILNPTYDTLTKKNYDSDAGGFFSLVRGTIKNNYGPTATFGTGPMLGVVLRIEGYTNIGGSIDPTSWTSTTNRVVEENIDPDGPQLIQLRIRIPELHASLPIPTDLPKKEIDSEEHNIINMYPLFTGQTPDLPVPVEGDLVWVDFQNRETMKGGIYVGSARSQDNTATNFQPASAKETFEKNRKTGTFNPIQSVGPLDLKPLSLRGVGYEFRSIIANRQSNYLQESVIPPMKYIASSFQQKISNLPLEERPFYQFLVLGDASKPQGGQLGKHKSHKVGEDIDIGTPYKKVENAKGEIRNKKTFIPFPINSQNVSVEALSALMQSIFEAPDAVSGSPKISAIFMPKDYASLSDFATRLSEIRNNSSSPKALLRYSYNDGDHFHVRFDTPKGQK